MAQNTYAEWTCFKKGETRWCRKAPFCCLILPTVVLVYIGGQAICASDRHICMVAFISRKTGKLVYTIEINYVRYLQ